MKTSFYFFLAMIFLVQFHCIYLCGSCTPGTTGPRLRSNKSWYGSIPSSGKLLRKQVFYTRYSLWQNHLINKGLSPNIILRKHNTYKHTTPYMKFKLKLLHIKCHILEFTKDEAKSLLQRMSYPVFMPKFSTHRMHDP
jgi:hypothetical protein